MGWHYILELRCKILPEFKEFIEKEYLRLFSEPPQLDDSESESEQEQEQEQEHEGQSYHSDPNSQIHNDKDTASTFSYIKEERQQRKETYLSFTKTYKDLIDIWCDLDISHFYKYSFKDDEFHCEICKKVTSHRRDLKKDYERFLKDIIVPISSEITYCEIESDDYGDFVQQYTDAELRGTHFNLRDQIKSIEHTYNEDRTEIYETRVVYKRSIKKIQFLDLDREYKGWY
jgi:hypothetical protein